MAGAPFWGTAAAEGATFSDDPHKLAYLGGDPVPGLSDVKGIAQLELDKKKEKGHNGVKLTVTGYQPGPFELVVEMWTSEQWDFMQALLDKYWNGPRKARAASTTVKKRAGSNKDGTPIFKTVTVKNRAPMVAISIDHAVLQPLEIFSCVIQGVGLLEPGTFEGARIIRFKCVEHLEPDPKTATKSAKASAANVPLDPALQSTAKSATPAPPSTDRKNLGPRGPQPDAGGGSD